MFVMRAKELQNTFIKMQRTFLGGYHHYFSRMHIVIFFFVCLMHGQLNLVKCEVHKKSTVSEIQCPTMHCTRPSISSEINELIEISAIFNISFLSDYCNFQPHCSTLQCHMIIMVNNVSLANFS